MRVIGIGLWMIGAAIVAYAVFVFDPSISSGGYRVVNLDLQQRQLLITIAGAVLFFAGVILHTASFFLPVQTISDEDADISGDIDPAAVDFRMRPDASITDEELAKQEADALAFARSHGDN